MACPRVYGQLREEPQIELKVSCVEACLSNTRKGPTSFPQQLLPRVTTQLLKTSQHVETPTDQTGFGTSSATKTVTDGVLSLTMSRNTGYVLRFNSFQAVTDEEFWSDNVIEF